MDLSETIAPKSAQLDAVDLLTGPRTFTVERVEKNNGDQPANIFLKGFPRPWRPNVSMRRVLVVIWGKETSAYAGRRLTLYCDPDVKFGGVAVGGVRISHMSHLDSPKKMPLLVSQGKSAIFTVQPLPDEPADDTATDWAALIDAATSRDELTAIREQAKKAKVSNGKQIDGWLSARATALNATQDADQCPVCGLAGPLHDEAAHAEAGA